MYLTYIVPLSILIPISIGLYKYKSSDSAAKSILFYLLLSGLINLVAIVMVLKFKMRNLPLLHVYTIVEATLILNYFRIIFIEKETKRIIAFLIIVFPLLCIVNFTFIQDIFTFNTHTRPLEALLLTFLCLLYFYRSNFIEDWINKPNSWFSIGIMIYFPIAFIIFASSNYLILVSKNKELNDVVWKVNATLSLVMYLAFARGFSLIKREGRDTATNMDDLQTVAHK